jgi:hypothetical protein
MRTALDYAHSTKVTVSNYLLMTVDNQSAWIQLSESVAV